MQEVVFLGADPAVRRRESVPSHVDPPPTVGECLARPLPLSPCRTTRSEMSWDVLLARRNQISCLPSCLGEGCTERRKRGGIALNEVVSEGV